MKCPPYHSSPVPNPSGIYPFSTNISSIFTLHPSFNHWQPIFYLSHFHFYLVPDHQYFIFCTNNLPSLYQSPCRFSSFFIPASALTSSPFFSIKGSAMPWGSFVIPTRGLWVGEGGRKEGRKRQFLKEIALCLWRQVYYRSRTASRWVPGRKLGWMKR